MIISKFNKIDQFSITGTEEGTIKFVLQPEYTTTDDTYDRMKRTDPILLELSGEAWEKLRSLLCGIK